jgi:hypothetical protein
VLAYHHGLVSRSLLELFPEIGIDISKLTPCMYFIYLKPKCYLLRLNLLHSTLGKPEQEEKIF